LTVLPLKPQLRGKAGEALRRRFEAVQPTLLLFLQRLRTVPSFPTVLAWPVFYAVIYATMRGVTALAARMTTWESGYHGMRLPRVAVVRAMGYQTAHILPVALLSVAMTAGYVGLLSGGVVRFGDTATVYLTLLSTLVVVGAGYLFLTYWTAMRAIVYANR
jgi:hypothetical protein